MSSDNKNMSTIRMEMWKKKKIEKNKEKCRKYYEKKGRQSLF
jgi:hypothetical protein